MALSDVRSWDSGHFSNKKISLRIFVLLSNKFYIYFKLQLTFNHFLYTNVKDDLLYSSWPLKKEGHRGPGRDRVPNGLFLIMFGAFRFHSFYFFPGIVACLTAE